MPTPRLLSLRMSLDRCLLWCGLLLPLLVACEAGTGGKAVNFDMTLRPVAGPDDDDIGHFVNDRGWGITLDEAYLCLGPIYLWENPPNLSVLAGRSPLDTLSSWLVPRAHAHAGDVFFAGGQVFGEYREQVVLDALGPGLDLGTVEGVEGRAQTFSMELSFPLGQTPGRAALDGHQAWLSGVARQGEQEVRFAAGFDFLGSQLDRTIAEIPVDAAVTDFGRFDISVRPSAFFRGADFGQIVTAPDDEGRVRLTPEDQPHVQMRRGLQRHSSYDARWRAP